MLIMGFHLKILGKCAKICGKVPENMRNIMWNYEKYWTYILKWSDDGLTMGHNGIIMGHIVGYTMGHNEMIMG